jgi:hypothetical protein
MNNIDDSQFIVETDQIKKAINFINVIDNAKFRLLIQRIVQKLHLTNETYFKEDEIEKLENSLEINLENLNLIINFIEFVYLQSAYFTIKPNQLEEKLNNLKLNEEKTLLILELWKENAKEIVDKIRETKSISYKKLVDIRWRLNLQLASDLKSKQKLTNALVEFQIARDSNDVSSDKENVLVEFTRDELYDFFLKFDIIQKQLDNLNA